MIMVSPCAYYQIFPRYFKEKIEPKKANVKKYPWNVFVMRHIIRIKLRA